MICFKLHTASWCPIKYQHGYSLEDDKEFIEKVSQKNGPRNDTTHFISLFQTSSRLVLNQESATMQ